VFSPVDVPLFPVSRPCRLLAISQQPPTSLSSQDSLVITDAPRYEPHRKESFQQFSYCCGHYLATATVYRAITCYIAPFLRLIPNNLQVYSHFLFSVGCACDICDRPRLPSPWLGSHGHYSPTAPAAPPFKAACPKWFYDNALAGHGVPPSSSI
jgi:hypothetical protein